MDRPLSERKWTPRRVLFWIVSGAVVAVVACYASFLLFLGFALSNGQF